MTHKRVVRWSESLATGIRSIDQQHYEWLSRTNDLISLHQEGRSTQALDDFLPCLKTYVLFHFSEEEMLLDRVAGGTEFERQHLGQHRAFARELEAFCQKRSFLTDQLVAESLGNYLENWLINHIASADQQLAHLVNLR